MIFGNVLILPCWKASTMVASTSWYIGSPAAPDSLVRSSTAIDFTVAGNDFDKMIKEKGLNKRTCITPIFSPAAFKAFTVSINGFTT